MSESLNQWADAVAMRLVFQAIRVSGRVVERISLGGMITNVIYITGRSSDNVTNLAGKIEERIDIAGGAESDKVSTEGKITEEVSVAGKLSTERVVVSGGSE